MLCASVESPSEGRQWQYELKPDGFRAIGRKSGRITQLWSRNHKHFTHRFAGVANALLELPRETVIDGEIVALDQEGKPAFHLLLGYGGETAEIVLYVFDLFMFSLRECLHLSLREGAIA